MHPSRPLQPPYPILKTIFCLLEDRHYRTRHPNQTRRSLQELAQEQYQQTHRHRHHHPNFYYFHEPQEGGASTSDQYRLETLQEQFTVSRQKHRRPSTRPRSPPVGQTPDPDPVLEVTVPERVDEVRPRRRLHPPSLRSSPSRTRVASPPSRLSRFLKGIWRCPVLASATTAAETTTPKTEKTPRRGNRRPYLCCTSGKNRSHSSLYLPQPNNTPRARTTTTTTATATLSDSSRNTRQQPRGSSRHPRSRGRQSRRAQQPSVKGKSKPKRSLSESVSTPPTVVTIARPHRQNRRPRRLSDQQEGDQPIYRRQPQLSLSTVYSWCPYCLKTIPGESDLNHHRTHHLHNLISPTPGPLRTHSQSSRSSESSRSRSPSLSPRSRLPEEEDEALSIYSAAGSYLSSDLDIESTPVVLGTLFTFAHPLPHLAQPPVQSTATGLASDPSSLQSILPQEARLVAALSPPLLLQLSLSTSSSSASIDTSASSSSSTSSSTAPPPLLEQLTPSQTSQSSQQQQQRLQQFAPPQPPYHSQRHLQESRLETTGNRFLFQERLGQQHRPTPPSPLSLPPTVTLESPAPAVPSAPPSPPTSRTPALSSTPVGPIGTAKVVTTAAAATATATASISLYRHFLRELDLNPWFSTPTSSKTVTTFTTDSRRNRASVPSKRFTLPPSFHIRSSHTKSASGTAAASIPTATPTVTSTPAATTAAAAAAAAIPADKERRRSSWSFFPFKGPSRQHSRTSSSFPPHLESAVPAIPAVPASWTATQKNTRPATTKATTAPTSRTHATIITTAATAGENHSLPAVQTLVQGFPQAQQGPAQKAKGKEKVKEKDEATSTSARSAATLAKSRALLSIIRAHHRDTDNEDVEIISKPHSTLLFTSSSPPSSSSASASASASASSSSSSSPALSSLSPPLRLHIQRSTEASLSASSVPAVGSSSFSSSFLPLPPPVKPSPTPSHPSALTSGATTTATMPTIVAVPPTSAPSPPRRKRFSFSSSFERVKKSGSATLLEAQIQQAVAASRSEEVITASTATVRAEAEGKEKKKEEQRLAMLATEEPTALPFVVVPRPSGSSSGNNGNGNGNGHGYGHSKRQPTTPTYTSTSSLPPPPPPSSSKGMFRPRHQSLNIGSLSILGRRGPKDDPSSAKPPLSNVTGATTGLASASTAVASTSISAGGRNRNSIAGPIMSSSYYDPEKPLPAIVDGDEDAADRVASNRAVEAEPSAKTRLGTGAGRRSNPSLTVSTESASVLGQRSEQQVPSTPSSPTTESKPHQRRRSFLPTALMTSNLAKFVSGVNAAASPTTGTSGQNPYQGPSSPTGDNHPKSPAGESVGGSSFRDRSVPQRAEDVVLDETTLLTIEQFKWGVLCCCHAIKSRVQKRQLARKDRLLSAQVSQGSPPVESPAGTGAAESGAGSKAWTGSSHSSKSGSPPNSSSRKKSSNWSTFNNSIGISINNNNNNSSNNNNGNYTQTSNNSNNNATSQDYGSGQGTASSNFTTFATTSYEARLAEARSTLQALIRVMMESVESSQPMTAALNTSTGSVNLSSDVTNKNSTSVHPLSHYSSLPSLHGPFTSSQATSAIASAAPTSTPGATGAAPRHHGNQVSQSRLQLTQATDAILNRLSIQGLVQVLGYTLALAPQQWIPWHLYDFFERPQGRSYRDLVELLQTHSQRVVRAVLEAVECLIEYGTILEEELEEERAKEKQDSDQAATSTFTAQEVVATPAASSSAVMSMALRLRSSQGQMRSKNEDGEAAGTTGDQGGKTHSTRSSVGLAMALSVLEPTAPTQVTPPKNPSPTSLNHPSRGQQPPPQSSTNDQDSQKSNSSRDRRRRVIIDGLACLVFRPQRMDEMGAMSGRGGVGHDNMNSQLPPVPPTYPVSSGSKTRSALSSGDDWSWLKRGSATLTGSGSMQQRSTAQYSQPQSTLSSLEAQGASREQKIGRQAFENLVLAFEAEQRSKIPPAAVSVADPALVASAGAASSESEDSKSSDSGEAVPSVAKPAQETKTPRHAHSLPVESTGGSSTTGSSTTARSLSLPPWRKQQQQQQQQQASSSVLSSSEGDRPLVESPVDENSLPTLQRPHSQPSPTRHFASTSDAASSIVTAPVVRARQRNITINASVRSTWTWSTFENHMLVMAEEEHLIVDNSDEDGEETMLGARVPRQLPNQEEELEIVQLEIKEGSQSPILPVTTPTTPTTSPAVPRWRKQSETFGA
ncbi:hypothetical protein EMPS_00218 [Entomortierella parvispora]|uniref:C2H2-type domain-containing protein n=1 Tax=Entomortierella parvispora TaxID=205924 RepID=A0A9P3H0E6_9FUNG|nr:hypothetical protein EMPS_00218 [Entomortierella parvispora]